MTSSSQIAGGRRIELSDSRIAVSVDGCPAAPFSSTANTPITTDVEEGVREVPLRKGTSTLRSNRDQILKEVWLTPELGH